MAQFSSDDLDNMFSSMAAYSSNTYATGNRDRKFDAFGAKPYRRRTSSYSAADAAGDHQTNNLAVEGAPQEIAPGGEFVWLDEVNSTMDEAKQRVPLRPGLRALAVQAGMQVNGRGTKGRQWFGRPGNVFLTIVLPMERVPVPLSLLPLRVGVVIADAVAALISRAAAAATDINGEETGCAAEDFVDQNFCGATATPEINLKWPNDVLVNDDKVAGVLIEGDGTYLHIGIGINVRHAPEVPSLGMQRGRTATCLADHGVLKLREAARRKGRAEDAAAQKWAEEGGQGILVEVDEEAAEREADEYDPEKEAAEDAADDFDTLLVVQELGKSIAKDLMSWIAQSDDSPEMVLADWSKRVNWSKTLLMRDEGPPDVTVQPISLELDGRLRVKNRDGTERILVAEYLF